MKNYNNYSLSEENNDISCATAIRKLYYIVAPSVAWFSLKIVDETSKKIYDELAFSKNNDADRKSGEERLESLLEKLDDNYRFATTTCEIKSGFGNDYIVKVYVNNWQ